MNLIPSATTYEAPKVEHKTVSAIVTAYTSSIDETDDTPNLTASGKTTGPQTIACPSRLKFGTKVEVNEKIYTCEDRMHARYRDKEVYDIWLPTKELAYQWGKRNVEIKIYENL